MKTTRRGTRQWTSGPGVRRAFGSSIQRPDRSRKKNGRRCEKQTGRSCESQEREGKGKRGEGGGGAEAERPLGQAERRAARTGLLCQTAPLSRYWRLVLHAEYATRGRGRAPAFGGVHAWVDGDKRRRRRSRTRRKKGEQEERGHLHAESASPTGWKDLSGRPSGSLSPSSF